MSLLHTRGRYTFYKVKGQAQKNCMAVMAHLEKIHVHVLRCSWQPLSDFWFKLGPVRGVKEMSVSDKILGTRFYHRECCLMPPHTLSENTQIDTHMELILCQKSEFWFRMWNIMWSCNITFEIKFSVCSVVWFWFSIRFSIWYSIRFSIWFSPWFRCDLQFDFPLDFLFNFCFGFQSYHIVP
jgi:hypothetical protein